MQRVHGAARPIALGRWPRPSNPERPGLLDRPQRGRCLSLVSALATYLILTGLTPISPRNERGATRSVRQHRAHRRDDRGDLPWQVSRPLAGLAQPRSRAPACTSASSRLFSIIAALPALLLAIGATTTFSRSLDGWFSTAARAPSCELARRRQRLSRRARAGDPHRHRQHGARTSTMAAGPVAGDVARVPATRDGASRPARSAGRLCRRRPRHADRARRCRGPKLPYLVATARARWRRRKPARSRC